VEVLAKSMRLRLGVFDALALRSMCLGMMDYWMAGAMT